MRKALLLSAVILILPPFTWAQRTSGADGRRIQQWTGVPTGSCDGAYIGLDVTTAQTYVCDGGSWMLPFASRVGGILITGTPAVGQVPISTSSTAAAWGDPIVSGPDATGAAPTKNPIFTSGWDGTSIRNFLLLSSSPVGTEYGLVTRNIPSGTQVVSGTITTSPPANASTNLTQVNGSTLGAPSAYGTSPGAVTVPGVNAFITNTPAVTLTSTTITGTVAATQSGTWTVQPGNTANTTAWKVDGSAVTQPVSGTFFQATQPVSGTVTANIGTSGSLALDASVTGLQVSQGSTTSGQKGGLAHGAVTTAAPSYTTAQTSPLSLTTGGLLRTDGSGVTQPVSGTVSANASQTGTWTVQPGNTANTTAWKVDGSAVTQPVSGTFFQATQPVSGTVTANQGGTWTVQPGNTANTTAWKVDGSAVTQPVSGTFFQTTQPVSLTSTTITGTVASTQSGNWTSRIVGNAGAVLDAAGQNVAAPANWLAHGCVFFTSPTTLTTGNGTYLNCDTASNLFTRMNSWLGSTAPTVGSKTSANSIPIVIASDQGSIPVAATLTAETTKVIGTVRATGNVGGVFDTTQNAAVAANSVLQGCNFTTSPATVTTGNQGAVQCNSKGELLTQLTDGTTNVAVISGTTALKTDMSSVAGTATSTAASGVQLVGIEGRAGTSFETTAGVLDYNLKNINNSAVSTAATGVQKVGITGNAGATLDSTIGAATAPTNALTTATVYQTTVPALTAGQAVATQSDTTGSLYVNTEGRKQTYSMSVRTFTPVASASSPLFSIQGSATKTVRITHVKITASGTTGTATPFANSISFQKFSALTGGTTGNTPTGAKNDTNNAAQTAVCLQYSAVPTTATAIGGISRTELMQVITSTATANGLSTVEWTFGDKNGQGLVLRGTSEFYGIVVSAVAAAAPIMSIWIEWVEDNS